MTSLSDWRQKKNEDASRQNTQVGETARTGPQRVEAASIGLQGGGERVVMATVIDKQPTLIAEPVL